MARTRHDAQPPREPSGRRARQPAARQRRVEFSLTEQEYQELSAAAARNGLARGAYAADAALAAGVVVVQKPAGQADG
jgi:hypothetical protein